MMRLLVLVSGLVLAVTPAFAANPPTNPVATPNAEVQAPPPQLDKTPGDFLKPGPYPSASQTGFYHEIPANLEPGVRMAAEDNFASSTVYFEQELKKAKDDKERARILMWLGVTQAQEASDYQAAAGWYGVATTATKHLREAIKLDPEVFKAPDVARSLGQMVGSGWAPETPEAEIEKAEKKGKEQKSGIDYFYAGVVLNRIAQRSWEFSDTKEDDERSLGFFARSVVLDPDRYENWPMYLSILARLQMYDLLTTDGEKMYNRFRPLRAPLFVDQGPDALYLRTRGNVPRQIAEEYLNGVKKEKPDDPYPYFALALVQMGAEEQDQTTPSKSIQMMEEFLASIEKGQIKLMPREQGYRVSALYKLGYLYKRAGQFDKALQSYKRVQELSPKYAETDYNLAETYLALAESLTTGTAKLDYLEKGRNHARLQTENDYKNRASLKADELRRRISSVQRRAKSEIEGTAGNRKPLSTPAPK